MASFPPSILDEDEARAVRLVALALLGALVATVSVVVRWSTVSQIADSVAPGVAGGLVMIVAHVSYVPTFVLWALSVIATIV